MNTSLGHIAHCISKQLNNISTFKRTILQRHLRVFSVKLTHRLLRVQLFVHAALCLQKFKKNKILS